MKRFLGLLTAVLMMSSCVLSTDDTGITPNVSANTKEPVFSSVRTSSSPKKRGVCYNSLTDKRISLLTSGNVVWAYNWGITPQNQTIENGVLNFMPMMWGGVENVSQLRSYLDNHPEVEYLLGINEPNMSGNDGGCSKTPIEAAKMWPTFEKVAEDYNLKLVSPAMTYSGATLSDGKVYGNPEDWLDAFIAEYKKLNNNKEPRMDYIALHSYMAWPSAVLSYCDKYAKMYNKKILLTEFCAWWDEGQEINEDWQCEKMAQKIEAMDQDDNIEAYAWFKADGILGSRPWNSLFNGSKLSKAGAIYTYLGTHDKSKYFKKGEAIPAVSYYSSSNYNTTMGTKPEDGARYNTPIGFSLNTDPKSVNNCPLIISDFGNGRFANYQIDVTKDGAYELRLRVLSNAEKALIINGKTCTVPSTNGKWQTLAFSINLKKGKQELKIESKKATAIKIAWLDFN